MRSLAALLLVLWASLSGCAASPFERWSRTERALFAVSVTCHVADYRQTEWALENGFREMNPLLGTAPSDTTLAVVKTAAIGATWWMANSAHRRRAALLAMTLPCLAIVAHNHSEGARP